LKLKKKILQRTEEQTRLTVIFFTKTTLNNQYAAYEFSTLFIHNFQLEALPWMSWAEQKM